MQTQARRDASATPTVESGEMPRRLSASPLALIRDAIGGPAQVAGKLRRLARTIGVYFDPAEVDRRLRRLEELGLVRERPTRLQILFGGLDMLRFVIEPAARDYYEKQGISFSFHQFLRILDDPVSMIDPTGFLSERDTIIGHVMQVVHLNPVYDLQVVQMFPDGLDELERQVQQMVDGTHPRQRTIGAIVEDAGYHRRLLGYVRQFRTDPRANPPVREQASVRRDENFLAAERTFAALPGFIAYCHRLPTDLPSLLRRHRALGRFPIELAVNPEEIAPPAA